MMDVMIPVAIIVAVVLAVLLVGVVWNGLRTLRDNMIEDYQERKASVVADLVAVNDAEFLEYVASGRKIEAIKRYRDLTSSELFEAKTVVDTLSEEQNA